MAIHQPAVGPIVVGSQRPTARFREDVLNGLSHSPKDLPCKYFYDETNVLLSSVTNGRVRVKDVTVFETDTTTARYSE